MTEQNQNFEMWSGNHRNLNFNTTGSDGNGFALTGASVIWVLSDVATGASLVRLTTDSGSGITLSGSTYTVSLSPVHTAGLSGIYYHESKMRDAASQVQTVAVGLAKINFDVAGS